MLIKFEKIYRLDDIPFYFVELAAPILSPYLTHFIEMSFKLEILKVARVIPTFKKGSNKAPENYRPISILPALSKIFEKVISTKLLNFFNQNSILQCKH